MRNVSNTILALLAGTLLASSYRAGVARADEAPADPTRGQWDSFLDPVRDLDDQVVDGQKWVEDNSKIHLGAGIVKNYLYSFNDPDSDLLTLHSLDPDAGGGEFDFAQLSASRPSEGWWVPGFGVKFGFGRAAKRYKADWNGNGSLAVGDTFEKTSFEVQEAYLNWTVPDDASFLKGTTFKGGKFVTLLGAEVIEPWANYNYSRSFLFGLAIPFTHTGGLVTVPITEKLSASGGVIVGWDNVGDNNNAPSGIGNLTWIPTDMLTFGINGIYGAEQTGNVGNKRGIIDLVATIKATEALTFVLNYDWAREEGGVGHSTPATWQGFALVANYAFTDRFSSAVRGEWFEDHEGVRTGTRQTLWETTLTSKYLITQHLYGQVEYRHDESSKGVFEADTDKALRGNDIIGFAFTLVWT